MTDTLRLPAQPAQLVECACPVTGTVNGQTVATCDRNTRHPTAEHWTQTEHGWVCPMCAKHHNVENQL